MDKQETAMVGEEIEILMQERACLLKVAGAAAELIKNADPGTLPESAVAAAEMLSEALNALPEETLKDALDVVLTRSA